MLVKAMEISNDQIARAEHILLKPGDSFDEERRGFITDFNTLDLKAVPGSGKTTALLAKLIVLESHLPLDSGKGILVISHTNAAVDEIKSRLGNHCPKLLEYPNFVGTIQEFVDRYLALPYYSSKLKCHPSLIEDNAYTEAIEKASIQSVAGVSSDEKKRALYWLNTNGCLHDYRLRLVSGRVVACKSVNGDPIEICEPKNCKAKWSDVEKQKVHDWLVKLKHRVIRDYGVLHYDDAYYLAQQFLKAYPSARDILRARFQYVFVDEMQDMRAHQHDLLEELFYSPEVCYQRIGDNNQAIFGGGVSDEVKWSSREDDRVLAISGSHRLTPETASVVFKFAVDDSVEITGLRPSGSEPQMIVFHESRIQDVIPAFASLFDSLIPKEERDKYPVMAVGWVKAEKDRGKLGINSYQPSWQEPLSTGQKQPGFSTAYQYLQLARHSAGVNGELGKARTQVLRAVCKALKLSDITPLEGRFWSINKLDRLMREEDSVAHDWTAKVFCICTHVKEGDLRNAVSELESLFQYILQVLEVSTNTKCQEFWALDGDQSAAMSSTDTVHSFVIDKQTGLRIYLGTIHSAKGQTHTATLLMETYYKQGYESTRLKKSFLGKGQYKNLTQKTAARLTYVAMSRPTQLLVMAISEDNFKRLGETPDGWEITHLKSAVSKDSAKS